ncbi:glycosyltransferase [Horticoccus luteus]|uniref:Glycosyltransferase n=1 Tax=Horticoccus luteus TaxID=2862869 RepID=A0A8F9XKY7_9BACT|nr:glycosyltransferase [Horticoccus luteus]QYM80168.1 glycosyltransferase [Horticoccus luteus]
MKILLVQDYLRSGGTERQSILLANEFAHAGHTVGLLTFRPGGPLAPTVSNAVSRLTLQPVDLHLDWFAPGLVSRARRFAPAVILCMGRMANCYSGHLQRRLPSCAIVGTLRTGKPLPWLFRRSLPRVRHVVANSREARDHALVEQRLAPARSSVIYNSLVFPANTPQSLPSSPRGTVRAVHGARDSTTVLLNVAMFRPEKNQRELIEIAAGLPAELDWQLWLAGDGPARAACEQLAEARGLTARVKFLGWQKDPSALYAGGDIAVHASTSESLSNFLIEAQAHGLPAVACAAQGIRECFIPGETGVVLRPGDRHGFRAAVLRFAEADPLRAARARAFARETFDVTRQVDAYLDLFLRLATPIS